MIKCKLEIEGYVPNPLDGPQYASPPMPTNGVAEPFRPYAAQSVSQGVDSPPAAGPLDSRPLLKLLLTTFLPVLIGLLGGKLTQVNSQS